MTGDSGAWDADGIGLGVVIRADCKEPKEAFGPDAHVHCFSVEIVSQVYTCVKTNQIVNFMFGLLHTLCLVYCISVYLSKAI